MITCPVHRGLDRIEQQGYIVARLENAEKQVLLCLLANTD